MKNNRKFAYLILIVLAISLITYKKINIIEGHGGGGGGRGGGGRGGGGMHYGGGGGGHGGGGMHHGYYSGSSGSSGGSGSSGVYYEYPYTYINPNDLDDMDIIIV